MSESRGASQSWRGFLLVSVETNLNGAPPKKDAPTWWFIVGGLRQSLNRDDQLAMLGWPEGTPGKKKKKKENQTGFMGLFCGVLGFKGKVAPKEGIFMNFQQCPRVDSTHEGVTRQWRVNGNVDPGSRSLFDYLGGVVNPSLKGDTTLLINQFPLLPGSGIGETA